MKISIEIDCTPQEARAFFGLPDVEAMQNALLKDMQERMSAGLKAMDPETMFKAWFPATLKGFEQFQDLFAGQMEREKK